MGILCAGNRLGGGEVTTRRKERENVKEDNLAYIIHSAQCRISIYQHTAPRGIFLSSQQGDLTDYSQAICILNSGEEKPTGFQN